VTSKTTSSERRFETRPVDSVVVRFCGDSGDGMQLTGGQFTAASAIFGNDIATFPDFPAEIRAPRGTTYGVSGFQVRFASTDIYTPGDRVNALVAMNPAGFKTNIGDVEPGGIVIVNEDEFDKTNLRKSGYEPGYNPLEDDELNRRYQISRVPMSRLTRESLADSGLGAKEIDRCRNMFALGIVYWLYDRAIDATVRFLDVVVGFDPGVNGLIADGKKFAYTAAQWHSPLVARRCVPVDGGDGIGDQVPPARQVVVDKRFDQHLVDLGAVVIAGKRPELAEQKPVGSPPGLNQHDTGGARTPLAGTELILGGRRQVDGRPQAPDKF